MTVETFLRKRRARHAGEVGLFPDSPMAEEDFAVVPLDADVRAELATERNLYLLKFVWGLADVVAKNTEFYLDKDDAMNGVDPAGLKVLARHCKQVVDRETGEVTIRPMSLKRLTNEAFMRLKNRMEWVVLNQVIPGIDAEAMRAEIESYIGKEPEAS